MKIIIDGPNNIGKSYLVTRLSSLLPEYTKDHCINKTTYTNFKSLFNKSNIILDRGPISELVYSKIYGRKSNLTLLETRDLLEDEDILSIVLINDAKVIKDNYKLKNEQNSDECNFEFIMSELQLFTKYGYKTHSHIIKYNFEDADDVVNIIYNMAIKYI